MIRPGTLHVEVADGGHLRVVELEDRLHALAVAVAELDACGFADTAREDAAARLVLEDARAVVATVRALGMVPR